MNGWTALMQATFYGHRGVAKILLASGADPLLAATNGCTALDLATLVEETDTELLRLLAGAAIDACPPKITMKQQSAGKKDKDKDPRRKKEAFATRYGRASTG